jgi:hypothetical protein
MLIAGVMTMVVRSSLAAVAAVVGLTLGCGGSGTQAATGRQLAVAHVPNGIAVNATHVYWTEGGPQESTGTPGAVRQVPIAGGAPIPLVPNAGWPTQIAVDAKNAYWGESIGATMEVPLAGGTPMSLGESGRSIAVDGSNVYATGPGATVEPQSITSAPIGSAAPAVSLGNFDAAFLAVDGENLYFTTSGGVSKLDLATKALTVLASNQGEGWAITVDATSVYWTSETAGSILKVPIAGGPVTVLAAGQDSPYAIAVDEVSVYWANSPDSSPGTIMRVPIGGGSPVVVAANQEGPIGLALDATQVYWANQGSWKSEGAIMATSK